MLWLIGFSCLAIGVLVGIFASSSMNTTSPARITALEDQVQDMKSQHEKYKDNVGQHFSMTAELVQQMTESYRDVYQHLATGAQELCSRDVASKLLPASEDNSVFGSAGSVGGPQAPRDYATRTDPDQAGTLSEEFGIEKTRAEPQRAEPLKEAVDS